MSYGQPSWMSVKTTQGAESGLGGEKIGHCEQSKKFFVAKKNPRPSKYTLLVGDLLITTSKTVKKLLLIHSAGVDKLT